MEYKIQRQVKRGAQYEIIYDVSDDFNNLIVGGLQYTVGSTQLDGKALGQLFKTIIFPQFEESISPAEQETFTREEIEDILKEKGYLEEGESFEDLAKGL